MPTLGRADSSSLEPGVLPPMNRWLACACLALSMALVGSYVALSKPLLAVLPVFLLAWLRFAIAALAMPHWLRPGPGEAPVTAATQRLLFLEALLGNFLFSLCMLGGMRLTSAVAAGVILATLPAVVALLGRWLLHEPWPPRLRLALACGVLGLGLLSLTSPAPGAGPTGAALPGWVQRWSEWLGGPQALGHLLMLGAVLCEAAYVVIGKRLTQALGPRRITAWINLWGLMLMTPLALWVLVSPGPLLLAPVTATQTPWLLAGLVFYALAASMWTVWLWMTGLRGMDAAQAGVFTVLMPVSAAAVGVGVLGEPLGMWQALALGLALLGVLLATVPARVGRRSG